MANVGPLGRRVVLPYRLFFALSPKLRCWPSILVRQADSLTTSFLSMGCSQQFESLQSPCSEILGCVGLGLYAAFE